MRLASGSECAHHFGSIWFGMCKSIWINLFIIAPSAHGHLYIRARHRKHRHLQDVRCSAKRCVPGCVLPPLLRRTVGGLLTRASSALTSDSSISACLFSLFIAVLSGAQELIWKVSRRPQHPSTGCRKNCSEALFLCADLITIRKDRPLLAQRLSALLILLSAAPQAHVFIFLHPRRSSPPRTIA